MARMSVFSGLGEPALCWPKWAAAKRPTKPSMQEPRREGDSDGQDTSGHTLPVLGGGDWRLQAKKGGRLRRSRHVRPHTTRLRKKLRMADVKDQESSQENLSTGVDPDL